MSVVTADTLDFDPGVDEVEPLNDDQAAAFLEQLEHAGVNTAARLVGVHRFAAFRRRLEDPAFWSAWEEAVARRPARRLQDAADELFWSIEAVAKLDRNYGEGALDWLINKPAFNEPMPCRDACQDGVDPEQLAAARDRLTTAGREWALALTGGQRGWRRMMAGAEVTR